MPIEEPRDLTPEWPLHILHSPMDNLALSTTSEFEGCFFLRLPHRLPSPMDNLALSTTSPSRNCHFRLQTSRPCWSKDILALSPTSTPQDGHGQQPLNKLVYPRDIHSLLPTSTPKMTILSSQFACDCHPRTSVLSRPLQHLKMTVQGS